MENEDDNNANDSNNDIISEDEMEALADTGKNKRPDDAVLDAEDLYYLETPAPSIQRVLGRRIPVLTRSRRNAQRHEE